MRMRHERHRYCFNRHYGCRHYYCRSDDEDGLMKPCERESYMPSISSQLNYIQSAINCGRITVEALALYLEQQGWCCHAPRQNETT